MERTLNNNKLLTFLRGAFVFAVATSCAPARHDESPVSVDLSIEKSSLGAQALSSWGDPTQYCLLLHITSPGAPFMKEAEEDPSLQCAGKTPGVGIVYGLFEGDRDSVSVEVPVGPKRRIDLLKVQKNVLSPELSCQEVVDVVVTERTGTTDHSDVDLLVLGRTLTKAEQDTIDVTLLATGVADIIAGPNTMLLKLVNNGLGARYTSDCTETSSGGSGGTTTADLTPPVWSTAISPSAIYLSSSSGTIMLSSTGYGVATDNVTSSSGLVYEYSLGSGNTVGVRNDLVNWTPYNSSTLSFANSISSDGLYYLNLRVKDQAGNFTYKSVPVTRDSVAPSQPSITSVSTALNPVSSITKRLIPNIPFDLTLACESGTTLTFSSADFSGLTSTANCSAGSVVLNSISTSGGSVVKSLTVGIVDLAGNSNSRIFQFRHCPTNFVFVPGGAGLPDFCVAKYEMSYNSIPAKYQSAPSVTPKNSITLANAVTACQTGLDTAVHNQTNLSCDVIGNLQWQKIAHGIRSQATNLYSGKFSRGYFWVNPSAGFCNTDNNATPPECGVGTGNNTRTFLIENGEASPSDRTIWDFAGNLSEFVKEPDTTYASTLAGVSTGTLLDLNSNSNILSLFGGSNLHTDAANYVGEFYKESTLNGAIVRGGSSMDSTSGIYYTVFGASAAGSTATGFRCSCKITP